MQGQRQAGASATAAAAAAGGRTCATAASATGAVLNDVVKALKDNPQIHLVEIGGHTDSVGKKDDNLMLSQRRAESVRDYLVSQGVVVQRLRAMGYGDRVPVASNDTRDGREQNRRVEFRIIKQGQ